MAVFALAFGAYVVVADESASAATDGYTMEADYQVLGDQPYVHLTVSSPIYASPAKVTITGEDFVYNTLALFLNDAEAYVEVPEMDDGLYTVTLDSKATGMISADFRASEAYPVTVRTSGEGSATVDKPSAHAGDTVTITATPAKDYKVKEMSYNGKVLTGTNTFTMPAGEVLVFVEFEPEYVECTVTFVIADDFYYEDYAYVGYPIEKPADPKIIGADFEGWFLKDHETAFDFTQPLEGDTVLYAHFGPVAPSEEQTEKFVAAMSDDCNLVLTAYDGNIIGKGTATVTVLQEVDFLGLKAYIEVGTFTIDIDVSDCYAYQNISEEASEYITESGNYAMSADIVLDNKTTASSNYIVFDAVINEQA